METIKLYFIMLTSFIILCTILYLIAKNIEKGKTSDKELKNQIKRKMNPNNIPRNKLKIIK